MYNYFLPYNCWFSDHRRNGKGQYFLVWGRYLLRIHCAHATLQTMLPMISHHNPLQTEVTVHRVHSQWYKK